MQGYGQSFTTTLGSTNLTIKLDQVEAEVKVCIVRDDLQNVPILIGRNFTEKPHILLVKDQNSITFINTDFNEFQHVEDNSVLQKIVLRIDKETIVPNNTLTNVEVYCENYEGDLFIEAIVCAQAEREYLVPNTVITVTPKKIIALPCINLSEGDIIFRKDKIFARAWPCTECKEKLKHKESVLQVKESIMEPFSEKQIKMGPVGAEEKKKLIKLLNEYRDCFAQKVAELGCASSIEMEIHLNDNKPFTYKPYRMARAEQEAVKDIIEELILNNIIRESDSDYCSPVLLVKKKNGENRMCIDYRKLNSLTLKNNQPLPRIDEQIDRLQGGVYFISLDLKSGYYQIPLAETSKRYTSFVTPVGQYEFNRMPFGLTNAPRIFQKFMNKILKSSTNYASVYLDDVLLHGSTADEALGHLKKTLDIFREEGLTLNLEKCSFLMESVTFLGFEVGQSQVRPGQDKVKAVEKFQRPQSVHQVRQFLGLTGYFRHFVQNYASIAKPLTNLTKKTVPWSWKEPEEKAFRKLQAELIQRPTLTLFDPNLTTEVHTDASTLGLAGILLQLQPDQRYHPVAYYSRQTIGSEQKYHSYELETLAVVESLKKFRSYLLGINFTVVTDCNSLKATSVKKQIIPRIARWWLQLQEFTFEVKYRPGNRMKHVDALSRNPSSTEVYPKIMKIEQADWVLSGQLTDDKIVNIREILMKPPESQNEHQIYKNYTLKDGRVYRITARGIQWVVPKGMRHQVVHAAHDDFGHFALEKTLYRLCEHYWFPKMRQYVEKYLACCIQCLCNKKNSGRKEGYLHPIEKTSEPINTIHIDHLGPFPKSKKGNMYLIVGIDAFTKFVVLQAVKTTKTKYVIEYCKNLCCTYGSPKRLITDQGSCFTSKHFKRFCSQNNIKHVLNAVATPRANGQVERLNRTILGALLSSTLKEERWDENVRNVQFGVNNVRNKSTGKTPSQLLLGFTPRGGSDSLLTDEIKQIPKVLDNLLEIRRQAAENILAAQQKQKFAYDKKRKSPKKYKVGDLVLILKNHSSTGTSRKLLSPYEGPMIIKVILPNDRYLVTDMPGSRRLTRKATYEKVIAVDRLRPWIPAGGVSSGGSDESSDEDGVVLSDPDEPTTPHLETS